MEKIDLRLGGEGTSIGPMEPTACSIQCPCCVGWWCRPALTSSGGKWLQFMASGEGAKSSHPDSTNPFSSRWVMFWIYGHSDTKARRYPALPSKAGIAFPEPQSHFAYSTHGGCGPATAGSLKRPAHSRPPTASLLPIQSQCPFVAIGSHENVLSLPRSGASTLRLYLSPPPLSQHP